MEYVYDSLGRVEYRTLTDADIVTRYHYEVRSGSVSMSSTRVQLVMENGVSTYYDYDEMGNIVYMDDSTGRIDTYTYDDLNQLLTANVAGKSYAYTYDAGGNILTAVENGVTHTYTYGNTVWRDLLTAYDGHSITYDQIGNPLTYRNGMQFLWEHGRQLRASLNGSTVTNYTYNADGTRHSKTVRTNVEKTTTYYYVEGVLYAVESPEYTVVFQFDDTGRPYGFRLLLNNSPGYEAYQYYKYNLQGDVVGIYDISGNEVVTYTYDPWGKLLSADGVDILIDANPLLYRGYVYDKETGFYYCNSRYYDPETGRWINADGYVSTGQGVLGTNMFAYCGNNPVVRVDVDGKCWGLIALAIVVIGSATLLTGCSAPSVADAPDLDLKTAPATSYNCYGNAINKETTLSPSGYERGDSTEKTFENVISDVGEENIRRLNSIDDAVYPDEYRVALRCGPNDYHFIRETSEGWYNKSGSYGGFIVTAEYVSGTLWIAQGYHPYTGDFVTDSRLYYDQETIYFAIKVGWDHDT